MDDDDTQPVAIAIPRTGSDDNLVLQVLVEGAWHQRLPDLSETACRIAYHSEFAPLRREEMTGELCVTCFGDRKR